MKRRQYDLIQRQLTAVELVEETILYTNKTYQEQCNVSKATATRDLSELAKKLTLRKGLGILPLVPSIH